MKTLNKFKRGDTLSFIATLNDQEGNPIVNVASNLKADVRTSLVNGNKLAEFVITEGAPGSYLFTVFDTRKWPIATVYTDIQYTNGMVVSSSETIAIPIEVGITV